MWGNNNYGGDQCPRQGWFLDKGVTSYGNRRKPFAYQAHVSACAFSNEKFSKSFLVEKDMSRVGESLHCGWRANNGKCEKVIRMGAEPSAGVELELRIGIEISLNHEW